MAVLKVARLGHPIIRTTAKPVPLEAIQTPEIQRLIEDMIETMRDYQGVGLAAIQVHVPKQIAVLEVHHNPRYPYAPDIPLTVLINPTIAFLDDEMVEDWEGCLSAIDFRGKVPRYQKIRVHAYDREGRPLDFVATDFHARVIQHEFDHLHGTVFLDRMRSLETLTYLTEYNRFWEGR